MSKTVRPYQNSDATKKEQVASMFNNISGTYDFLNHFLSLGIDMIWRKIAIRELIKDKPAYILDVATGTGDLAFEAIQTLNPDKVVGIDIADGMLSIAREKILKRNMQDKFEVRLGDSEKLLFEKDTFDAVTVAFGVRNFEHLEIGLGEMLRVLKPQGMVVILEFSQPTKSPIKQGYNFYSKYILPGIGQLISKERSAYEYLPASVSAFPFGEKFTTILQNVGYSDTKCLPLTFGIASIYTGRKK